MSDEELERAAEAAWSAGEYTVLAAVERNNLSQFRYSYSYTAQDLKDAHEAGYLARATEEAAAKADRAKRGAELVAKLHRVVNAAAFGIPADALPGVHADINELAALLESTE